MPKISVIVPVYNTEQYLRQCLDSILCQTFSDFELILVDDASTDRSGVICDDYSMKDKRVKIFHCGKNSGVSAARNIAIDHSTGECLVFIDSDDFIDSKYLETLNSVSADLVLSNFKLYWPSTSHYNQYPSENGLFSIESQKDAVLYLKGGYAPIAVWGKLFCKSIIERHNIRFDTAQKTCEDILFVNEYIKLIKTYYKLDYYGYYHCQYETDTLSSNTMKKPLSSRMDWWGKTITQFEGYPVIQDYYARMFLYLFEKEMVKISSSKQSFKEKNNLVKEMLRYNSIEKCISISPEVLPKHVCLLVILKISMLLLIRYRLIKSV